MSANRHRLRQFVPILLATVLFESASIGANSVFFQLFTEAKSKTNGFLYDASLTDRDNLKPALASAPISFAKFALQGELAGIKLGMTMSEVVAAWGKPRSLFTHCVFGPRFWYGTQVGSIFRAEGGISLSFKDDRLVLIAVYGDLAQRLKFNNGLNGGMGRAECENLLGPPDVYAPDWHGSLYVGDIVYRAEAIRTDLQFYDKHLHFISVRLEQEARREQAGRPPEVQDLVEEELLPLWLARGTAVWDRAAAVNRIFTNGTPIPVIIAVLGTNFSQRSGPISTVSLGPEPRRTSGLEYRFDKGRVIIHTTADVMTDPRSGEFTGAGYWVEGVWIGRREGAPGWNEPFRLATNRTSVPTESRH